MGTFTCPQKLYPPPSKGNPDQMLAQDPVLLLEAAHSVTNPLTAIVLLTGERLVPMVTRPVPLDPDLPQWNSEEDLAEARPSKFIMSKLKMVFVTIKPPKKM